MSDKPNSAESIVEITVEQAIAYANGPGLVENGALDPDENIRLVHAIESIVEERFSERLSAVWTDVEKALGYETCRSCKPFALLEELENERRFELAKAAFLVGLELGYRRGVQDHALMLLRKTGA